MLDAEKQEQINRATEEHLEIILQELGNDLEMEYLSLESVQCKINECLGIAACVKDKLDEVSGFV